jgi:hypothetical protein
MPTALAGKVSDATATAAAPARSASRRPRRVDVASDDTTDESRDLSEVDETRVLVLPHRGRRVARRDGAIIARVATAIDISC